MTGITVTLHLIGNYSDAALNWHLVLHERWCVYGATGSICKSWHTHHVTQRGNGRQQTFFMAEDYAAFSVSSARIAIVMGQILNCRRQAIMADPPFAAACVAEQALGGKIEQAPAPPPARGIRAIDLVQHRIDFGAMGIEQRQPVARGAGIMIARPAPLRLNPEQIGKLRDQAMELR